jgi:arylsulfatase A-like enzyme
MAIKSFPTILCPKQHRYIPLAEDLNKHAIRWVKNQKSKFFLWLHYMDVHEPYAPPYYENNKIVMYLTAKYRDFPNMLTKKEIQKLINLYDLEIKYTDKALNSFIQDLKKIGKYDNSIIIISADHGDAFGEHDTLGHGGKFRAQLYDEVIHVPLIISGLNKKGIIIDRQVQLLGLAPTICELVNIKSPPHFFGRSFFSKNQELGMIANSSACIAYRTKKYKFIINKTDNNEKELYDLENDPGEKINIYNNDKILADRLESEMINLLEEERKKRKLLDVKLNFK